MAAAVPAWHRDFPQGATGDLVKIDGRWYSRSLGRFLDANEARILTYTHKLNDRWLNHYMGQQMGIQSEVDRVEARNARHGIVDPVDPNVVRFRRLMVDTLVREMQKREGPISEQDATALKRRRYRDATDQLTEWAIQHNPPSAFNSMIKKKKSGASRRKKK